jgi:negative regulator of replication initiation
MKTVELSEEAYEALQRLAAARNRSPSELLAAMLTASQPPLAGDNLLFFLTSPEFTAHRGPAERYLALLAWVAGNYAGDFADFISHQESGRRYLTFSRDDINEVRARNQARPIDGTPYWAVMTISDAAKHRFARQLLEFVGCHDETVTQAGDALAGAEADIHQFRLAGR